MRTTLICIVLAVALAYLVAPEVFSQTPNPPTLYSFNGHPVVCVSGPSEGKEEWRAMCAPLGPWRPCVETAQTIDCTSGKMVRSTQ